MSDIAKGSVIGVIVAVLLFAILLAASGLLRAPAPSASGAFAVQVIGPDGKPETYYGNGLLRAEVPGSDAYAFCAITGINVERPSMLTSSMPNAGCLIERGANGTWQVSTGEWQGCQVSCFKAGSP